MAYLDSVCNFRTVELFSIDVTSSKVSQIEIQSCQKSDNVLTQYPDSKYPPIYIGGPLPWEVPDPSEYFPHFLDPNLRQNFRRFFKTSPSFNLKKSELGRIFTGAEGALYKKNIF